MVLQKFSFGCPWLDHLQGRGRSTRVWSFIVEQTYQDLGLGLTVRSSRFGTLLQVAPEVELRFCVAAHEVNQMLIVL